jgi:hypothetical protein
LDRNYFVRYQYGFGGHFAVKNWRKIVFWFGIAAFLACMAWTIMGH